MASLLCAMTHTTEECVMKTMSGDNSVRPVFLLKKATTVPPSSGLNQGAPIVTCLFQVS